MELKFQHRMGTFQFSCSVVSDSFWPHELQHARPPCPSPTPGVHPNPCPLSRWCHPAISSSVVPFSSCPQSLPASGSFPMSQLFAWGGILYWSFSFSISTSKEHPGLISQKLQIWSLSQTYYIGSAFNKIIKWVEWALMFETNCSYNGNPLQYSCLENPMDGGAWEAAVHGVAKSRKWLDNWAHTHAHTLQLQRFFLDCNSVY